MGLENNRWHVYAGDCLWDIAQSVYNNPYRWREIADANGIPQSSGIIYPHQLLALPGITPGYGGGSNPNASPSAPSPARPRIEWFKLVAGSDRTMEVIWAYDYSNHFWYRWEQWDNAGHLWIKDQNTNYDASNNQKAGTFTFDSTEGWNVCRFAVRPVDNDGNPLPNTDWGYLEYDFRNNPPLLPPDPEFEIDAYNKLTVTMDNINEHINGTDIEIAIYQDDTIKFNSPIVPINFETLSLSYTCDVDPGHTYRIRCRAIRGNIYGGWTNFTTNQKSTPVAPDEITTLESKAIVEQGTRTYGIYIEWSPVDTADSYTIEYTTNPEYFDSGSGVTSVTVDKSSGEHTLLTDIELGHEYFFRVNAVNEKGQSKWTDIRSTNIGTRPSAPTTWTTITSVIIGNSVNLYWTHNSTDGSVETVARLHMEAIDTTDPSSVPMVIEKIIHHQIVENEANNRTSSYTIDSTDPEWTFLQQGFKIKWKVQTAGVTSEYSEYSTEREINFYAQPTVTLDLKNNADESIDEVSSFPFYLSVLATPPAQTPISYYVEVIANEGYITLDNTGNQKVINAGDIIYAKTYDPTSNAWRFLLEFTPGNIDLQSGISYTINCTVAMDSGLNGSNSKTFSAFFDEKYYDVRAIVNLNTETYEATINPLCYEFSNIEGEIIEELVTDCLMSVYRINYDGSFTEIAKDINNQEGLYITDPHPTLDYARYRIVAKESETGAMSYADIEPVKFGEFAIIIQWAEKWINFDESGEDAAVEKPWSGSLLRLPYNITISDNNSIDMSLVEYVGRSHPVSYYGTQLGESSTWTTAIPKDDKETLYAIRRLSKWTGDVYVREPSGTGYWANISVNYNINYDSLIIPVTMNVTRVEGGI